ncbi:MAG: hypothetical protein ACRDJ2_10300 [Actinomycetota bacterium]
MKLAAGLFVAGLALAFFGITLVTIGGPCPLESCGPSINELALLAGGALMVSGIVAGILRPRPR